jgi:hypothetical protein
MRRRPIASLLLAAGLALVGAACGDDDDADPGGSGRTDESVPEDGDGGSDTESGDPSGNENGVVEGEGDAAEGDGTETDSGNDAGEDTDE